MLSVICSLSGIGTLWVFEMRVLAGSDVGAADLFTVISDAGRKATDVVMDAAFVPCGEGFARIFALSAFGIAICPWVVAGFANIATAGALFVVATAFGVGLGVDVGSRMVCFGFVDELFGPLVLVVAGEALKEALRWVTKGREELGCDVTFGRDAGCFCLSFPPSDEDGGNPEGWRNTGLVFAPFTGFDDEHGCLIGVALLTGFLT